MYFTNRREILFVVLAGFFITNALVAEMIGGKLIDIAPWWGEGIYIMSVGILPWPVVFLTTDLMNEYYGKQVVRKLSFITAGLIFYAFIVLFAALQVPAIGFSPVNDSSFQNVFGQSVWIILGSITAFLMAQLTDVFMFWFIRKRTGRKMIWLRATGSTVVSQFLDTIIVGAIGLRLPAVLYPDRYTFSNEMLLKATLTGYSVKLVLAIVLTPLIYIGHRIADRYLGDKQSDKLIEEAAREGENRA